MRGLAILTGITAYHPLDYHTILSRFRALAEERPDLVEVFTSEERWGLRHHLESALRRSKISNSTKFANAYFCKFVSRL